MNIINIIRKIERWIVVIGMGVMTAVTIYAVFNRFVLKQSIQWSDELTRYIFIWVSLIGSSIAVEKNAHVGVSVFVDLFPIRIKKYIYIIAYLFCLFFCIILVYTGFDLANSQSNQFSAAMRINMKYIFLSIPVSFSIMGINFIGSIVKIITNKELLQEKEV